MKLLPVAAFAALIFTSSTSAVPPGSSMPDITRQYYERSNCHQAYDLAVDDARTGKLTTAETQWAQAYEDAGEKGRKCPAVPAELARRAVNHIVANKDALGQLTRFVKADDPAAYFEAGTAVINDKVPGVAKPDGVAMIRKSAELGYAPGQYMTALFHVAGVFGEKDYAGALPLFEAAAAQGHVDAIFQVGNFYKDGIGVKKDSARAFASYQRAAEMGHLYAAILAFYMIQDGEGTRKDFKLAYTLARNLADHGEAVGAVLAASALLQQKNAVQNEDETLYWLDLAIRDGDNGIRDQVSKLRPQIAAAFSKAKAPPEYHPRERKLCPLKTVCFVDHYSGLQDCHTNVDYWHDCDF